MKVELIAHPDLPGLFLTEDGRVFRELPSYVDDAGYTCIHVTRQIVRRHVLVAEAFVGPRPHLDAEVRHLDGNPGNDAPANLAWGTRAENMADMIRHGRSTRGTRNPGARLTEAVAREIKRRRAAGESGRSLAAEFNLTEGSVCDIHKGRTWGWLS